MEIVAVDGEPALKYGMSLTPYVSASTPQSLELRTYRYSFLQGAKNQGVNLTLRNANGRQSTLSLARSGYSDITGPPNLELKELPGQIAYVALNSFDDNAILKQWDAVLPKILASRGLILDLRLNGGGDDGIGHHILSTLVNKPFLTSRQVVRTYNPTARARGERMNFTEVPAGTVDPTGDGYGERPIVVLAGPATFSAAEDFLVAWKNSGRGKTVGEPSGGSTGLPLSFTLPGGGTARVCTKRDTFPDGREWVGKGIDPDVLVRPTLASIRSGADPALETAVKLLALN